MTTFHVNEKGMAPCHAKIQCRLKNADGSPAQHFDNAAEAAEALEAILDKQNPMQTVSKKSSGSIAASSQEINQLADEVWMAKKDLQEAVEILEKNKDPKNSEILADDVKFAKNRLSDLVKNYNDIVVSSPNSKAYKDVLRQVKEQEAKVNKAKQGQISAEKAFTEFTWETKDALKKLNKVGVNVDEFSLKGYLDKKRELTDEVEEQKRILSEESAKLRDLKKDPLAKRVSSIEAANQKRKLEQQRAEIARHAATAWGGTSSCGSSSLRC